MGPNISPHYISITFAPLHFKYNYICHNLSGFTAWSAPRHYLIQCCNIVNRSLKNKPQWNFNLNSNIFIQENAFKSVVCKNGGHLVSVPVCFNWLIATLCLYINMRIRFELVKTNQCIAPQCTKMTSYSLVQDWTPNIAALDCDSKENQHRTYCVKVKWIQNIAILHTV